MLRSSSPKVPHYVGVTGVQARSEVESLLAAAKEFGIGPGQRHNLMVGALVSPSLITGGAPLHTSKPYRHVANTNTLREILQGAKESGVIGMLHFELHKSWPGTRGDSRSVISLLQFLQRDGLLPPVQLNGVLFPDEVVEIYETTGIPIVFQMRKEISDLGLERVVSYIEALKGSISKILMDPSAGTGAAIATEGAMRLYRAIEDRFPGLFTFGFAGGLGGSSDADRKHTTETVRSLLSCIPSAEFSLDSETKVRHETGLHGEGHLDIELSRAYFSAVNEAFGCSGGQ
jgi:hypothetical protein